MSLFWISWRSIEQRGVASLLTTLSMALGVMMVVAVLSIYGVVAESFRSNASLGYNLIVGAKGGKLQLTLNTVYYLSQPVENVPYDYLLEFYPRAQRDEELKNSLLYQSWKTQVDSLRLLAAAASDTGTGFGTLVAARALQDVTPGPLEMGRNGKYSQFTGMAIPVCLGDYYGRFRVVGTTSEFLDRLTFGPENDRQYEFAAGRNIRDDSDDSFFEAVVGATVADEMDVELGQTFCSTHGDPEGEGHGTPFTVVGILKPTGTPNDRVVLVNVEGFYLMEDHAKPIEEPEGEAAPQTAAAGEGEHDHAHGPTERLPLEQREVTAILLRTVNPLVTRGVQNSINEGPSAQAVLPVLEIFSLFEMIVRPIQLVLLSLTGLICLVSGISILVSIYNSMSDRKHDIAVMRALGASRGTVMTVILLESVLLSLGGGVLGWLGGHSLNWLASGQIEARTGVSVGFLDLAPRIQDLDLGGLERLINWASPELLLVPALIALAVLVGFLPALAAYRTDVAKSLHV